MVKFTPTEAGVIAAVYALVIGLFVYKELKISMLMECLVSAAKSSSVIMFLAAAAMVSSWMMTVANVPSIVTGILAPFIEHPVALMLIICLIVLLVGIFHGCNAYHYDPDTCITAGSESSRNRCCIFWSGIYLNDGFRFTYTTGRNSIKCCLRRRKDQHGENGKIDMAVPSG